MTAPPPRYYLGLDLGQAQDYSALAVLEGRDALVPAVDIIEEAQQAAGLVEPRLTTAYQLRALERLRGLPYPKIVDHVGAVLERAPLRDAACTLAIDGTGCGRPVVDLFRAATLRAHLAPITITAGDSARFVDGYHRVPKRDLVGVLQVWLQQQRLQWAAGLALADTLKQELLNFRVKIDPNTAHDSYASWREGQHDDLVLATACAAWIAERMGRGVTYGPALDDYAAGSGVGDLIARAGAGRVAGRLAPCSGPHRPGL